MTDEVDVKLQGLWSHDGRTCADGTGMDYDDGYWYSFSIEPTL